MDFSISIGIDKYIHLNETPFAENDATGFNYVMRNVFNIANAVLLIGNNATYKNIESEFENIIEKIEDKDRFIFFFAGHGKNLGDSPYISTYDSANSLRGIKDTWHSLIYLIERINKTGCQKSLFFVDACESTIQLGSRDTTTRKFSFDEIEEMISTNTYSYVFSSCSHKGVADVYPEKRHGIWSYFLLQALSGKEPKALIENNCLTNESLSSYLNIFVRNYCKSNPNCDIQQTHTWGKKEGEFMIIKFPEAQIQKYNSLPPKSLRRVEFVTIKIEGIKQLSGFIKGKHIVPKSYSSAVERFILNIAANDIKKHIDAVANSLKDVLKLKRRDFKVEYYSNSGVFECPYFLYTYNVAINPDDISTVIFTASLVPHDVDKLIEVSKNVDKCFPDWFDYLIFTLEKRINISDLIDKVEELDDDRLNDFSYKYDAECTYLELENIKSKRVFVIFKNEISIKFYVKEEVADMLESLKDIANQIKLISPTYKLLG
ncbi:MAG: caspase family protein [Prevotella sp.]|jgi:hypothetical protein|nr:caspase family protein [Prevotella sp.]